MYDLYCISTTILSKYDMKAHVSKLFKKVIKMKTKVHICLFVDLCMNPEASLRCSWCTG